MHLEQIYDNQESNDGVASKMLKSLKDSLGINEKVNHSFINGKLILTVNNTKIILKRESNNNTNINIKIYNGDKEVNLDSYKIPPLYWISNKTFELWLNVVLGKIYKSEEFNLTDELFQGFNKLNIVYKSEEKNEFSEEGLNEQIESFKKVNENIWYIYENGGLGQEKDLKLLESCIDNPNLNIKDKFIFIDTLIRYYKKYGYLDKSKEIAKKYINLSENNNGVYDLYDFEFAKYVLGVAKNEKDTKLNEISNFFVNGVLKENLIDTDILKINEYLVEYGGLKDGYDFLTDYVKDIVLSKYRGLINLENNKLIYTKSDGTKWQISEMPWYTDQFTQDNPIRDSERSIIIKELGNNLKQVVIPFEKFISNKSNNKIFIDEKIKIANNDYNSEILDKANLKEYDIKEPNKLMYLSLSDSSDDVIIKGIRKDGEIMGNIIGNRRKNKETIKYNETLGSNDNKEAIEILEKYFKEAKDIGINDIVLNIIGHGDQNGIYFGDKILRVDDFKDLLIKYSDINISLNTVACEGGGIESLTKGLNRKGKFYTLLQVQEHVTNQEGRIDGLNNTFGEPTIYSSYYNIYLLHYLNKYPEKTFGEIHLLADKMTKEKMGNNAQIIKVTNGNTSITKGLNLKRN